MLEEKLKTLDRQYAELEARLAAPETYDDPTRVARLNKEQRDLSRWSPPTGPTSGGRRTWPTPRP